MSMYSYIIKLFILFPKLEKNYTKGMEGNWFLGSCQGFLF